MHFHPFRFHGKSSEFFGIWIVNLLLTILTLGIYSAWAKVRTTRYLYGNLELDEERFEYLAKPLQILIGRLIAIAFLAIWILSSTFEPAAAFMIILLGILLYPALIVRGLKFNMQMTQYRNVRFEFVGAMDEAYKQFLVKPIVAQIAVIVPMIIFASVFFPAANGEESGGIAGLGIFLCVLYLLVASVFGYAWIIKGINQYIVTNSRYGDLRFTARLDTGAYAKFIVFASLWSVAALVLFGVLVFGLGAVMFGGFDPSMLINPETQQFEFGALFSGAGVGIVVLYVGFIILSMISQAYFISRSRNYLYSQTTVFGEQVELFPSSKLSARALWWVLASNLVMIIASLGLAYPWAKIRSMRLYTNASSIEGNLELSEITDQIKERESALGEEVGEAFDFDIGVV